MQMDLRTLSIQPLRQTFGHLARRFGDKPASRYQEATYDLQPNENYHYRPTWDPAHDIFDATRTKIVMKDWDALKDPRQFYYGAWTLARGRMQETASADFDLAEEMGLAAAYPEAGQQAVVDVLLPLRHVAWGANLNNASIAAYGYGVAIAQAGAYAAMDQLGIAQFLTRLGLTVGPDEGLATAKDAWLHGATWQPLRRWVEDQMVIADWFELFVAQNVVLDGLLYPMVYDHFTDRLNAANGPVVTLLTRFQREWFAENVKWVDAVLKTAAAESDANRTQLCAWISQARTRTLEALAPVAELAFGAEAGGVMDDVVAVLNKRLTKAGLAA